MRSTVLVRESRVCNNVHRIKSGIINVCTKGAARLATRLWLWLRYDDFVFPPKRGDRGNGFLRGRVPDCRLLTWVDIESATPTSSPGCCCYCYCCCHCCCYCCCCCCCCSSPARVVAAAAAGATRKCQTGRLIRYTPTRRKVGQSRFIHPLIHKSGRKNVRVARGRRLAPSLFVYNEDPSPYHGRNKTLRLLRNVPSPASATDRHLPRFS